MILYNVFFYIGGDYNEYHSHATDNFESSNKFYGHDSNLYKTTHYLNPTYNSKINFCINDDYITIVDDENNRNSSDLKINENERESNELDENMNYVTPLISTIDLNNHSNVPKNLTGKLRNRFQYEVSYKSCIHYTLDLFFFSSVFFLSHFFFHFISFLPISTHFQNI